MPLKDVCADLLRLQLIHPRYDILSYLGGIKVSFEFDPDQYEQRDPINVMLKVKLLL